MMKMKFIVFLFLGMCIKLHAQQQLPLLKEVVMPTTAQNVIAEVVLQSNGREVIVAQSGKTIVSNLVASNKFVLENKITNTHLACTYDFSAFVVVGNSSYDFVARATNDGTKLYVLSDSKGDARAVAINPVNDDVLIGYANGSLRKWSGNGRRVQSLTSSFSGAVVKVAVSDDGTLVVAADEFGKIEILKSGVKKVIDGAFPELVGLCVSTEKNKILAVSKSGFIYSWDAEGNNASNIKLSAKFISSSTFSCDLKYAFIGTEMGKVLVYDFVNQQERCQFTAHSDNVSSLSVSDDGRVLATLSSDQALTTWSTGDLAIAARGVIVRQGKPQLTVGDLKLIDENANGKLEKGEKAFLQLLLHNEGNYATDSVNFDVSLHADLSGLFAARVASLLKINAKSDYTVTVPLNTDNLKVGTYEVSITVSELLMGVVKRNVLISSENNTGNYLMVKDWWFESPNNKVEKNIPLTLHLQVYNPTALSIENAVLQFNMPEGVVPMNRTQESVSLKAGDSVDVMTQMMVLKESKDSSFNITLTVSGVNYSNVADVHAICHVNEILRSRAKVVTSEQKESSDGTIEKAVDHADIVDDTLVKHDSLSYRGDPLASIDLSTAKKEMEIGNYYALIIGVDNYKSPWSPLKNAVHDAQSIENVLRSKYRFDHFKVLYNERATRSNVIAELEWLVANVKSKDNVFIYYSGHGDYKKDLNKGFWVPSDAASSSTANFISNSDIQTYLGGIKSKHTLLVSDACFSGDIFRGTTETVKFENSDKYYKKVYELPSRQAISSGGIEPVLDGGSEGHSIFAYYLLKVLQSNNGKYLDASQLYSKIKIPVVNNSEQDPKFAPIKNTGDEGGQFLFIKK